MRFRVLHMVGGQYEFSRTGISENKELKPLLDELKQSEPLGSIVYVDETYMRLTEMGWAGMTVGEARDLRLQSKIVLAERTALAGVQN